MDAERRLERVLRMLDQERRTARIRPRAEIDKELGHSAGYLSRVCKGVFVLDVPTLLRAVDLLGVDVDLFVARAFGTGRHIDVERHLAGSSFGRVTGTGDVEASGHRLTPATTLAQPAHGIPGRAHGPPDAGGRPICDRLRRGC